MKPSGASAVWKRMILLALALILLSCSLDPIKTIVSDGKNEETLLQATDVPALTVTPLAEDTPAGRVEQEAFTFEYDVGWQPYFEGELPNVVDVRLDVETLGLVLDSSRFVETPLKPFYYYAVVIMRKAIPAGSSLEEVYRSTYAEQVLAYPEAVQESVGQLGGLPALERVYPYYSGEPRYDIRELWVEWDGWAYILSQRAQYTNKVNLDRPGFKTIEDSFQFKD